MAAKTPQLLRNDLDALRARVLGRVEDIETELAQTLEENARLRAGLETIAARGNPIGMPGYAAFKARQLLGGF